MKNAITIALITAVLPVAALGIEAKEAALSLEDLAAHLGVRNKTFTLKHDGSAGAIRYILSIYQDGEVITSESQGFALPDGSKKPLRFSVLHKDEGKFIHCTVVGDGNVTHHKIRKPRGMDRLSSTSNGVRLDDEGRLVLAFHVEPDKDGSVIHRAEKRTAEGADAALVLQIRTW